MNFKWTRLASIPALALALVLASCDSLSETTRPELRPDQDGPAYLIGGKSYSVVRQKDVTVGAVTAVIGEGGGKLVLGKHELVVPRGAVSAPTTFTMTKLNADHVMMDLKATRLLPNDVGSRGFAVPLTLKLSYENTEVSDPSQLRVIWAKLDGTAEVQPTQTDWQGQRALAQLDHFSQYALAFP